MEGLGLAGHCTPKTADKVHCTDSSLRLYDCKVMRIDEARFICFPILRMRLRRL